MEALKGAFRPEFLNRMDEVLIFHRLGLPQIRQIVEIQLGHVRRRPAERKIALTVTDRAKEFLAREGYDPLVGARPLRGTLQWLLQYPPARRILEGEFAEGGTVEVDLRGGDLVFGKTAA